MPGGVYHCVQSQAYTSARIALPAIRALLRLRLIIQTSLLAVIRAKVRQETTNTEQNRKDRIFNHMS